MDEEEYKERSGVYRKQFLYLREIGIRAVYTPFFLDYTEYIIVVVVVC